MNNPLLNGLPQNNSLLQNLGQIKQAWGMLKSMGNPQAMLGQMLQNNPKMKEVQKLLEESGGDPEKAFRAKAKEMGVNPDDIINLLK